MSKPCIKAMGKADDHLIESAYQLRLAIDQLRQTDDHESKLLAHKLPNYVEMIEHAEAELLRRIVNLEAQAPGANP